MAENSTKEQESQFTARATLIGLGVRIERQGIMEKIGQKVKIKQKTVKDSPLEKMTDALATILAGGKGLVEANKRVRGDRIVQRAFGRERCAEQSVISETFDACDEGNVKQMAEAMKEIYQAQSEGYRHDYGQERQVLDVDLTGQPCGKKAAFASKAYFAHQRNRRGRQLGRVWATAYKEVVVDQLYRGNTILPTVLQELVGQAADILELDPYRRRHTILRIDAHGGSQANVNWMLKQGYGLITKEYNAVRASTLAESVTTWYDDPRVAGRQVGWVTLPSAEYETPLKRIAVRTRKKNGQWGGGVLLSNLAPKTIALLAGLQPDQFDDPLAILFAYVYFYDLRSGGIETGFKDDKQGLGITKRNKKSFTAQQMLCQLNALAHTLLIWFQQALAYTWPAIAQFGLLRLIRDLLHFNGRVFFDQFNRISTIVLNSTEPFAQHLALALRPLLSPWHIVVILDKI
jgi:hypothetical protein